MRAGGGTEEQVCRRGQVLGRRIEVENPDRRRILRFQQLPVPACAISQHDVERLRIPRQHSADAGGEQLGEGRFASFRQGAEVFRRQPFALSVIEGNRAAHRFLVVFPHQRQSGPIEAGGDDGDRRGRGRPAQLPAGGFLDRHLPDALGSLLQEAGGERQAVRFGQILRHFPRTQRAELEADDLGQQRRGRAEDKLAVGFQRAERLAPRAGLVRGARDGQWPVGRQVVPRAVGLAVPDLPGVAEGWFRGYFTFQ